MEVTFWGCRGSIPVSGQRTTRYGGSTSCVEVRLSDGTVIVLDAGTGIRNLGKRIVEQSDSVDVYLVLTHPHWDHLMGFPYFAPAYSDRYRIHVRGGPIAKQTVRAYLERQMQPPYFPARLSALRAQFDFTNGVPLVKHIGEAEVVPIALSHPNGGYGFRINEGNRSLVYLTDNELGYRHEGSPSHYEYVNFCRGADLLIHDAQYTGAEYENRVGWGHSTFAEAVSLAVQAQAKCLALFHHDPDHEDAAVDAVVAASRALIARQQQAIDCIGAAEGARLRL